MKRVRPKIKACAVTTSVLFFAALAGGAGAGSTATAAEPSEGEKLFALKVRPILREKCFGCHSESADDFSDAGPVG